MEFARRPNVDMEQLIKEVEARRAKALQMGGEKQVKAQHERGHLTARERIDQLLDPGSFWEVGLLNHSDVPEMVAATATDGRICGTGTINGRMVVVIAQDRTIIGGTVGHVGHNKKNIMRKLAADRGYPVILLGDMVGGTRLPDQIGSRGFSLGRQIGAGQPEATWYVSRETPKIATIMGECFGEPTWDAAQADFVVMVKGGAMGAAGPRIIQEAIGQKITPQELCGWELHATTTGQVDAFAENDEDCLNLVKEFLSYMPSHSGEEPPSVPPQDDVNRKIENVARLVPTQLNRGYDMNRLVKAIVDDGRTFQLRPDYAKALITSLGRIGGRVVGIVANNPMFHAGAPDVPACEKAIEFICMCDSFNIPLIFLADVPGMYPGIESERVKLPTKIVVWLQAIAMATVPKVHVLIRKAYGIGWRCMASGQEDMAAAWPTASISFVDPAIGVELVHGRHISESTDPVAEKQRISEQWAKDCAPWEAAGVSPLEIIDPGDTRKWIAKSLEVLRGCRGNTIGKHRLTSWPTGF